MQMQYGKTIKIKGMMRNLKFDIKRFYNIFNVFTPITRQPTFDKKMLLYDTIRNKS